MATRFQVKRSSVSGVTPTTSDIQPGELAINLADKKLFTANTSSVFELGSNLTNLSVTSNLTIIGVIANGSLGTSGQVLHSNGTATYWAADDQGVTSVATGNGLTGGTITTTGTVSVLANNGITANVTGLYVTQGTGTVVNSTGVHVNSSYIGTLTANNSTNFDGLSLATVQGQITGNAATAYANAVANAAALYQTTSGLSANVATLTANNASFLGGTAAASYQLNSTLAANVVTLASNSATYANASITNTFTVGTSTYFVSNGNIGIGNTAPTHKLRVQGDISLSGGIHANGSLGTAGQILTSNGTVSYWATPSGGGATLTANNTDTQTFYLPMANTTSGSWSNAVVSNTKLYFVPSTGTLNATIFNSLSDETLKKDVENISDALELVAQMRGIKFTWKDSEVKSSGVLAQELEKITPDLVNTNDSGIKSVNYDGIIAYLIEAVKEIKDKLNKAGI